MRRATTNSSGQALVETTMVLVLLICLVGAILEFGTLFRAYITITAAARQGARVAAVGGTDAVIAQSVRNSCVSLDAGRLSVSTSPAEALRERGTDATVHVAYAAPLVFPIIGLILPDPFVLRARMIMRVEQSP